MSEFPEKAEELFKLNQSNAKDRWNFYKRFSQMDYSTN
jgi:pyruvate-ferredoxin/flavodoxin oxidoreductase